MKGILVLLLVSTLGLSACSPSGGGTTTTSLPSTVSAVENGRSLYIYAVSAAGERITYTGGFGMMTLACVNCHGAEGRGGTINLMMQTFEVPNITWPKLTGPHTSHPSFTVDTVKQAITKGLDPAGHPLEYPMPIWQMSEKNLNDLVTYIQTLK
jgi:mono/diheme cytochrome c family protein